MICIMNSEDLASALSSSTQMNVTFLFWFLNVMKINLKMSIIGHLFLDGNPKSYEVAEHIATKVELNLQMIWTLKKAESIRLMKPGANFETSVVGNLVILVRLIKRQIGQISSNPGRFSARSYMNPFIEFRFSLVIETWPERWWKSWERFCFEIA